MTASRNTPGPWTPELVDAAPDFLKAAREAIAHNTDARNIKDEEGWVAITKEAHDMLRAAIAKTERTTP